MCDTLGVFSPFEMQHPGLHFYYGTCHSNLSLFSSLQKVPKKIQGYFLQNYILALQSYNGAHFAICIFESNFVKYWNKENETKSWELTLLQMLCSSFKAVKRMSICCMDAV